MVRLFTKHFWVINLLFIAAAAWLVAHLFAVVIQDRLSTFAMPGPAKGTGPAPAEKTAPYDRYAVILERNVFNPQEKGLKLLPLEDRGSGAAGPRNTSDEKMMTSGSYRLVGTVTGPGSQSWAVLQEGADRKQKMVPLGGDVDGGKIIQIFRNRIVIRRRGREEVLSIMEEDISPGPAASPATSTGEVVKKLSANRFLVNRQDVNAAIGNVNQFMTQARIKPYFVGGRPSGFSVSEIAPGSLMEKLGLQNGDVIKKVNGLAITKPEEVFQAYSQLQRDSNIEVEVERGNRSEVFRFEIR